MWAPRPKTNAILFCCHNTTIVPFYHNFSWQIKSWQILDVLTFLKFDFFSFLHFIRRFNIFYSARNILHDEHAKKSTTEDPLLIYGIRRNRNTYYGALCSDFRTFFDWIIPDYGSSSMLYSKLFVFSSAVKYMTLNEEKNTRIWMNQSMSRWKEKRRQSKRAGMMSCSKWHDF